MDLISAKVEAAKLSKEKSNKQFVNVDGEGECSVGKYDPKASTVCYSSGSQIPMPTNEPVEEKVKIKKEKKVKTKAKLKKVAKKSSTQRKAVKGNGTTYGPKVSGTPVSKSITQIVALIKSGKVVRNKSGFYYSEKFFKDRIDKTLKYDVYIK